MLEWLFILGLGAALRALLGRLKSAERRIAQVEADHAALFERLHGGSVEPPSEAPAISPFAVDTPAIDDTSAVRSRFSRAKRDRALAAQVLEPLTPSAPVEPAPATPVDAPETEFDSVDRPRLHIDLEDVFGRRLPIWAGGVALTVSGVFLVRYSIEQGLITPLLRVAMAFLFGFGLLAAAEAAHRLRERVADPRVGQALSGAGLATLYAAFYLAGTQYGLIGQTLAFLGLATVTAGAIALSFRFGLPSAVLGLVGGFAAPLLVGGDEANLPLLSLYLGLVTAGLVLSGRRQRRPWMGIGALVGGLGWGAMLLTSGEFDMGELVALGLYLIVLGAVLPALADAPRAARWLRLGAALLASVQLALLVAQAGHSPLAWALYLLLGATLAVLGWRNSEAREGNAVAGAVAVILLALWTDPPGASFSIVVAVIAAIFTGVPLALVARARERSIDGWQIAGITLGLAAVSYARFGDPFADRVEGLLAITMLGLAALPAAAAWLMRARGNAPALTVQLATAAALVFAALLLITPGWAAPLAGASVFAALFALGRERSAPAVDTLLWSAAGVVVFTLVAYTRIEPEFAHLLGWSQDTRAAHSLLRWISAGSVVTALVWREPPGDRRRVAEGLVAFLAYGSLAQILPRDALAWSAALIVVALHLTLRERLTAQIAALVIAAAWSLEPLGWWLGAAISSLSGDPILALDLPPLSMLATRVLPLLAALAVVRATLTERLSGRILGRDPATGLALLIAVIVAHILFKQLFAINGTERFVRLGLAERTLWQALLLGAAWLATTGLPKLGPQHGAAVALGGAALAHFILYTALLHNPLWDVQALGALPIANLATAAYAVGIAVALSLRHWTSPRFAPAFDGAVMGFVCLAALTLLRQAFAGSLPVLEPLTQSEDLLRSLAGILLALGFLWLGGRRNERSWRIGSLAIMLLAVAKVFLIDAAGLDGLLRVASFMALGFSLIAIGWIYTRQLRTRPAP